MSGSKQKKTRAELRGTSADRRRAEAEKAALKAKKERRIVAIVCAVLALLVAFLIVINSSLPYKLNAVTVGDASYSMADYNYFYKTAYYNYVNDYYDYLQYIGLSTEAPLNTQKYAGEGFETWADYFRDSALNTMETLTMYNNQAKAAGFTLSEEQQESLTEAIDSIGENYEQLGFKSLKKYLTASYGKGTTLERVSEFVTMMHVASAYAEHINESFEYSSDELYEHYTENKDDYDTFDFLYYFVSGKANTDEGEDPEDMMAQAKEKADAVISDADAILDGTYEDDTNAEDPDDGDAENPDGEDEDEDGEDGGLGMTSQTETTPQNAFVQAMIDNFGTLPSGGYVQGKDMTNVFTDWVRDADREYGDKTVFEDEENSGYYVLFFIERVENDYKTVAVRHILVDVEPSEKDENDEDVYTEEDKATAREEAERILAEWKAGEATPESFGELAEEYSGDRSSETGKLNSEGGLYENFPRNYMVSEFDAWAFDASRKAGDTGIVYHESDSYRGYHIMYFVDYGEVYRDYLTETDLRKEDNDTWYEEQMKSYEGSAKSFTRYFVR